MFRLIVTLLLSLVVSCLGLAATSEAGQTDDLEVLYFFAKSTLAEIPEHVQLAADALGVGITFGFCEEIPDQSVLKKKVGVLVSPEVALVEPECLRMLLKNLPKATSILFPGLRRVHQQPLRLLGLPVAIEPDIAPHLNLHELVVYPVSFASFFGGLRLPCRVNDGFRLILPGSRSIIGFGERKKAAHYIEKNTEDGREFFLLSDSQLILDKPLLDADNLLLQAMPYLIFFSRVGGDRVWQGSALFANLTIDDPFLVEPYGSLSFEKLLHEMDAHRFHTTIGFIPRNFDRNEQNAVNLFRSRPDCFSIAVHGNNHDRREFYRYFPKDWIEPFATKTLAEHKLNLAQALERMDEFSRITGILYDPVMIFPQSISPAPTLRLCKQLDYIATINGSNVPLDSEVPRRLQMSFRPYNTAFYSFLNLKRVGVNYYSELQIRADLFLHNPLFLYSHQDLFEPGIKSFNPVADLINNICPNIEWASLGKIVSHWFLWRRTANNVIEVKMLAPVCVIVNDGKNAKHYEISKEEDSATNILSITVNGEPIPWKRESDRLQYSLELSPGWVGQIVIQKTSDIYPYEIGLNDGNSIRVILWRSLAEFRDRVLSRFTIGIVIRDFLYKSGISTWIPHLFLTLIIIAIAGVVLWRFRRGSSKRKRTEDSI